MRHLFMFLMILSSASFADDSNVASSLSLDQVIVNVLENNPALRAADYEARAAAAAIRSARQSPAYKTSIVFENFSGSGVNEGTDNLETTLSLSKVLEPGDQAQLRGQVAEVDARLLRDEQDVKRLDLLAEAAKRFIHVVTDQERLTIARESASFAKRIKFVVERRVKAGSSPDAELRRAEIGLARNRLELDHAEHESKVSRMKLVTMWGDKEVNFSSASADLFKVTSIGSFKALEQLLQQNPDLVKFANEQRLASTRLQLAKANASSNIEISGGIRHFKATDDTAFVMSLNVPLGTSSRARPEIEKAELLNQLEPYMYEQRFLELHALLYELYQEINHSIDAVNTLAEIVIPNARKVLKDYEKGYAAGRYSLLELTTAQQELLNSRLELVMAATDYHNYKIEIDRLTGTGLSTGARND